MADLQVRQWIDDVCTPQTNHLRSFVKTTSLRWYDNGFVTNKPPEKSHILFQYDNGLMTHVRHIQPLEIICQLEMVGQKIDVQLYTSIEGLLSLAGSLLLMQFDITAGSMNVRMMDKSFIKLGASIELVCTWSEIDDYINDNIEVIWSFNNRSIMSSIPMNKYTINDNEQEQESVLRIKNISKTDQGSYTCHVGYLDHWAKETFMLDLDLEPEITKSPPGKVHVGDNAQIICKMIGQPNAEIEWGFASVKDKQPSNQFDQERITVEKVKNESGSYLILNIRPGYSQMGQYYCRSRGKYATVQLAVRGVYIKCSPIVGEVALNDDVKFVCNIESLPRVDKRDITWSTKHSWSDMYEILPSYAKFTMSFNSIVEEDWGFQTTMIVHHIRDFDTPMTLLLSVRKTLPTESPLSATERMMIKIADRCTQCFAEPLKCYNNQCMCPGQKLRPETENLNNICGEDDEDDERGDDESSSRDGARGSVGSGVDGDDSKEERGGNSTSGMQDDRKPPPKVVVVNHASVGVIVGVTMGSLGLILIVIILYICYRKRRKARKNNSRFDPNYVYQYEYHGEANTLNYNPTFMNPGYYMPVPRQNLKKNNTYVSTIEKEQLEFPREKLQLGVDLGEGRFGKVIQGRAMNITGSGNWVQVAVKTCRGTATDSEKQDLYQELELMRKIPSHPNIVALLGCCSKNEPLYIIMEYVHRGSLLGYLRKCRPMSQMSRGSRDSIMSDSTVTSSFMQPRAKDLTIFALQIARGMAHVNTCGIIHRDLAARNILLANDFTCKICDFGLARDVEGVDVYERTSKGPLPIRWMAPEALEENLYTKKSDIWSYGVLLWEIVTLGATPYQGKSANEVMRQVLSGFYLPQPLHCREEMYDLMVKCWEKAELRPTFVEIVSHFEALMDDDYIILSEYDENDYQWLDSYTMEERV